MCQNWQRFLRAYRWRQGPPSAHHMKIATDLSYNEALRTQCGAEFCLRPALQNSFSERCADYIQEHVGAEDWLGSEPYKPPPICCMAHIKVGNY